jgi:hypothetical protein
VIEPCGNLGVCATGAASPSDGEHDRVRRDLLESPNHQQVRALSSNASRRRLSVVDAIAESVGGFVGALRDPHITIKNVYQIEGEDAVVAEFAMTASVIPTGKHYSQDYVCYLRAANEKIAFYREYFDAGRTAAAFSP